MTTRILLLATLFGAVACANGPSEQDWKEGIRSYRAEDYRHAETLFERAVERAPDNSKYHLWLGLAIGRRAEGMTGLRRLGAMSLAKAGEAAVRVGRRAGWVQSESVGGSPPFPTLKHRALPVEARPRLGT